MNMKPLSNQWREREKEKDSGNSLVSLCFKPDSGSEPFREFTAFTTDSTSDLWIIIWLCPIQTEWRTTLHPLTEKDWILMKTITVSVVHTTNTPQAVKSDSQTSDYEHYCDLYFRRPFYKWLFMWQCAIKDKFTLFC